MASRGAGPSAMKLRASGRVQGPWSEAQDPIDHIKIRILESMISGIPLILCLGARRCDDYVHVVFWAHCREARRVFESIFRVGRGRGMVLTPVLLSKPLDVSISFQERRNLLLLSGILPYSPRMGQEWSKITHSTCNSPTTTFGTSIPLHSCCWPLRKAPSSTKGLRSLSGPCGTRTATKA